MGCKAYSREQFSLRQPLWRCLVLHSRSYDIQEMSLLGSLNMYCTCLLNVTLWLSLRFVYNKKRLNTSTCICPGYGNTENDRHWLFYVTSSALIRSFVILAYLSWCKYVKEHWIYFNAYLWYEDHVFVCITKSWLILSKDNENYLPYLGLAIIPTITINDDISSRNQHHHFDQLSG